MLWGRVHIALVGVLTGLALSRIVSLSTSDAPLGEYAFPAVVLALAVGLVVTHFAHEREESKAVRRTILEGFVEGMQKDMETRRAKSSEF